MQRGDGGPDLRYCCAAGGPVTSGGLHNRFPTKVSLIEAMFDRIAAQGAASRLADVEHEPQLGDALANFVTASCNLWSANPPLTRRLNALAVLDDEIAGSLAQREARRMRSVEALVDRLDRCKVLQGERSVAVALTAGIASFPVFDHLAGCLGRERATQFIIDTLRHVLLLEQ